MKAICEAMNKIADALEAMDKAPKSREGSLGITKLDEAMMWLNRACVNEHAKVNEAQPDRGKNIGRKV
jgi:hypothetical protein